MDGMREIRFFSKALFVGFKPRKESLLYVFNSIPYCGSEDISWGSRDRCKSDFILPVDIFREARRDLSDKYLLRSQRVSHPIIY